jgi:fructose-1-phosphate kinase PfkB-like protein
MWRYAGWFVTLRANGYEVDEAATGEAALDLASVSPVILVILGGRGALAACDGQLTCVPAPAMHVRHTTGAGDLFVAAYVWADLAGFDAHDRLRLATVYASRFLSTLTAFADAATLADLTATAKEIGLSPCPI